MTNNNPLGFPWSLHFDRDGTEDFGIICDAEGNDLVASHIPGGKIPPRWKDRGFGEGCFWLPEKGDPVPHLVRVMRLMTAAPKLLEAVERMHHWVKADMEHPGNPLVRRTLWELAPVAFAAIAEAEGT